MAYIPFEKRTKTEQRQIVVNRLIVWTRIAAQDVALVQLEKMAAESGFVNAHVLPYRMKEAHYSTELKLEAFKQAEEFKLVKP